MQLHARRLEAEADDLRAQQAVLQATLQGQEASSAEAALQLQRLDVATQRSADTVAQLTAAKQALETERCGLLAQRDLSEAEVDRLVAERDGLAAELAAFQQLLRSQTEQAEEAGETCALLQTQLDGAMEHQRETQVRRAVPQDCGYAWRALSTTHAFAASRMLLCNCGHLNRFADPHVCQSTTALPPPPSPPHTCVCGKEGSGGRAGEPPAGDGGEAGDGKQGDSPCAAGQ